MIWAAVSTQEQAADERYSLDIQVERCRAWLTARMVREAESPAIVAGHSREYLSLDAAVAAMPELARVIDAARTGRVNLLVVYDFNRFRSLQSMVVRLLAAYGCQVYSINQPVEPLAPETYTPWSSDTAQIVSLISSLTSTLDISGLRRKHATAMPERVTRRGLHSGKLPFGYRKPEGSRRDPDAVAVQVPEEVAVVRWMADEFKSGRSYRELAAALTGQGVATREGGAWRNRYIRLMLTNPFYAGLVAYHQSQRRRDPMTGKARAIQRPRADWTLGQGRHEAIWTEAEWRRLCAIADDRGRRYRGQTPKTHAFSRLCECAECGARMWHRVDLHGRGLYICSADDRSSMRHATIFDTDLEARFGAVLRELLAELPEGVPADSADSGVTAEREIRQAMAANENARARFQRAFGAGIMNDDDLEARLGELRTERARLEIQLAELADLEGRRARNRQRRQDVDVLIGTLSEAAAAEPARVNAWLGELVDCIRVGRHEIVEIRLRTD